MCLPFSAGASAYTDNSQDLAQYVLVVATRWLLWGFVEPGEEREEAGLDGGGGYRLCGAVATWGQQRARRERVGRRGGRAPSLSQIR
jgi:hypothetical protein